ncbi:unnamed protein product [Boreogadus saida]
MPFEKIGCRCVAPLMNHRIDLTLAVTVERCVVGRGTDGPGMKRAIMHDTVALAYGALLFLGTTGALDHNFLPESDDSVSKPHGAKHRLRDWLLTHEFKRVVGLSQTIYIAVKRGRAHDLIAPLGERGDVLNIRLLSTRTNEPLCSTAAQRLLLHHDRAEVCRHL